MFKIDYPEAKPSIRMQAGREMIFCLVRKRWLAITPEEWVRQNFLLFLTESLGYPLSLIAVEKQIGVGELKKRFDIVVFDRSGLPFFIIECKSMDIALSENALQQAMVYNIPLRAGYLAITNGIYCSVYAYLDGSFSAIDTIPDSKKSRLAEAGFFIDEFIAYGKIPSSL